MDAIKSLVRSVKMKRLSATFLLTIVAFLVSLVTAQITHSLTLLVVAYHMLYNLVAVVGCLATIKLSERPPSLRNTFGWTRVEILATLVSLVLLCSLCFSLCVEAVQTIVHSGHHDEMHHPIPVGTVAIFAIMINMICTVLIGGYSYHQGCFLDQTPSGVSHPKETLTEKSVRQGKRRVCEVKEKEITVEEYQIVAADDKEAATVADEMDEKPSVPSAREMFRDNVGCFFVIIDAFFVHLGKGDVALYADPIISIFSVLVLLTLSWPYFTQASSLLLQTIPGHLDVNEIKTKLLEEFPALVNVHELHIWSLGSCQTVASVHVVYKNKMDFLSTTGKIPIFFQARGISRVSVQPELQSTLVANTKEEIISECYLRCRSKDCSNMQCCGTNNENTEGHTHSNAHNCAGHAHSHSHYHESAQCQTSKYAQVKQSDDIIVIDKTKEDIGLAYTIDIDNYHREIYPQIEDYSRMVCSDNVDVIHNIQSAHDDYSLSAEIQLSESVTQGSYNSLVISQPEDTQATNPLISSNEATLSNYNEAQNQSVEGELNKCDVSNHPELKNVSQSEGISNL
ncbi:calcium/manganese antiporter SLC30A10-like [Artemia franciscana]|uniref:Cation efflux protein transmembrane domain-containing protein n=1 Tax=Artemia franciscana TaxID=6661 RepID=A0AA88LCL5_ARTSF|nr:hypothetical protein QYM36_004381 [Artemia franciscana]